MFGWLAKLFGYAAAPVAAEVLDHVAREARDYLDRLQDDAPPVPLPYKALEHQRAQERAGARAFPVVIPPTCPASLPPSAPPAPARTPPPDSTEPERPWHQASVDYPADYPPVSLPLTPRPLPPRPFSRASSGPPPRMSPPPPLPPPAPRPWIPRPARKR